MKALTLWQPWATLIAIGAKRIETRSWRTDYRGPLLIHASSKWNEKLSRITRSEPFFQSTLRMAGCRIPTAGGFVSDRTFPLGAVVAVARLIEDRSTGESDEPPWLCRLNVRERAFGDYRRSRYAWVLADVQALPEPIPWSGGQRLWNVPAELERRVLDSLQVPSLQQTAPAAQGLLFNPAGGAGPYGGRP